MERTELNLPLNGVSDVATFIQHAGSTVAPPLTMLNAWPLDPTDRRARLGKRPGLAPRFKTAAGGWWKAPSYIQGMGQVNIAAQTRLDPGGLATALLSQTGGGGFGYPGVPPNRDLTLIDNLNYAGSALNPPPTLGTTDYVAFFGTDEAIVGGEAPSAISSSASRWDRFASTNIPVDYGKDLLIVAYNYQVTAVGPGTTTQRARLVSVRKKIATDRFELVNEFELSDGADTGRVNEPTNGKINFNEVGDPDKPWHIVVNDIDIGPDFVYAAIQAVQTSDNNVFVSGVNSVTRRRGWVVAIPKIEFQQNVGLGHSYVISKRHVDNWAQECRSVRYRPQFSPTITVGNTVYGDIADVLVCFLGYRDFQGGVARFDPTLTFRLRMGEVPTWRNAGHGALKPAFVGQTAGQLDAAGIAALIDGDHGVARFSVVTAKQRSDDLDTTNDMTVRWTHGCFPVAMDVDVNGEIFIARTSVGIGIPDPDGTGGYLAAIYSDENLPGETVPRITVMAMKADGSLKWEGNTGPYVPAVSYTIGGGIYGPFFNDRFRPTLKWITADDHGGCLAVGHWAYGKNIWHVAASATAGEANVDWSRGIGIKSGEAKVSTGAVTRTVEGETIGIAELTMRYCSFDPQTEQYAVAGETFPPSTIVVNFAPNPPVNEWNVLSNQPNINTVGTWQASTIRKLHGSSGQKIWIRMLGDATKVGFTVEMKTPEDSPLNGAFIATTHTLLTGTSAATNSSWKWNNTANRLWLRNEAPAVRHVHMFNRVLGNNEEYVLQLRKRIHEIKAIVKSGPDGSDCWEVGTHFDTTFGTWKLVIRKVKDGVPQTFAADVPLAPLNLTNDNLAFELRVRIIGGLTIQAFVSTQPDPDVPAIEAPIDEFFEQNRIGIAANFQTTATGAENFGSYVDPTPQIVRVTKANIYTLIPVEIAAAQIICITSDGQLFVSWDGEIIEKVSGLNMRNYGLVAMAQFHGLMYFVDGEHGMQFDPALAPQDRVGKWTPTDGNLPGATPDGLGGFKPGTTTASLIANHLDCLWLAGMPEDPNNAHLSARGNANNWNPDDVVEFGASTNLSNELAGVIGVPITSLHPYQDDFIVVGARNQINAMYGHPRDDGARHVNLTREAGITSSTAFTFFDNGAGVCTTEQGLASIAAGQFDIFSKVRLHRYAVPSTHTGTIHTTAIRDGNRYGVFFGYTRVAAEDFAPNDAGYFSSLTTSGGEALNSFHLWWDERNQGFYPVQFPRQCDPVVVFKYGEEILFGCRDGHIRVMVDGRKADFGGFGVGEVVITTFFPSAVMLAQSDRDAVKITELFVLLSTGSTGLTGGGLSATVKRGASAEAVYARAPTDGEDTVELVAGANTKRVRVSGRALLITFHDTSTTGKFEIEGAEVKLSYKRLARPALTPNAYITPDPYNIGSCPSGTPSGSTIISDLVASVILSTRVEDVLASGIGIGGGVDPTVGGIIITPPPAGMILAGQPPGVVVGTDTLIAPNPATIILVSVSEAVSGDSADQDEGHR